MNPKKNDSEIAVNSSACLKNKTFLVDSRYNTCNFKNEFTFLKILEMKTKSNI